MKIKIKTTVKINSLEKKITTKVKMVKECVK